jgi:hypothetical protein
LQKEFLQRCQFMEHRLLDGGRQFTKQTLKAFDNVEQCRPIHPP